MFHVKHLQTGLHISEDELLSPPPPPHDTGRKSTRPQPRTISSKPSSQRHSEGQFHRLSEQEEQRRVGRNSLVMFSGTLASRLTGQIRTILLAAAIGVSGIAADAYQVGSQIPSALFNLLSGGIINAILVPQIVRAFRHKDSEERINKLITLAGAILIGFTALLMLISPALIRLYSSSSWTSSQRALAESFTLWCMPQVFFYGVYTVLGQVLAAKDRFGMYAWSSVAANLVSSAGFTVFILLFGNAEKQPVSFWTSGKIALTAGTWTAGIAVQALLLFLPLHQIGLHYRIRWGLHGIGLRSMGKVAGWSMAMVVFDELLNVVVTRIATSAPMHGQLSYNHEIPGSQAYMQGYQIWILPYSLIAVSVATAIFPVLSRAAASFDTHRAAQTLTHALKQTSVLMFFFSAVFVALPIPIIRALLPSVSVHDAHLVSSSLMGLAFCLPFATITLFLRRTFYAYEDGRTPFLLSVVINVSEAILLLIFINVTPPRLWTFMIGLALTLGNIVMIPFSVPLLKKHLGHDFEIRSTVRVYAKSILACVIDIVGGYWLTRLLLQLFHCNLDPHNGILPWWKAVIICLISGIAMLIVYVLVLRIQKTEGADAFMVLLHRFIPRGKTSHPGQYNGTDSGGTTPSTAEDSGSSVRSGVREKV